MFFVQVNIGFVNRLAPQSEQTQIGKSLLARQSFAKLAEQRRGDLADRNPLFEQPMGQAIHSHFFDL